MPNYIDMESGLKRVAGSAALFKKLLLKFADGNYQEQVESAIAAGDIEAATAAAHTVKGVAANLSLMEVNAAALELEQALKHGEEYSHLVTKLREANDATIAEIQKL